jgi:transposase-like protein
VGRDSEHPVTKPFSLPYKQKMIQRLTGNDAESARKVAKETGISQETLSKWLREARSLPDMPNRKRQSKRSVDDQIRVLAEASKVTGSELTRLLEREGLLLAELEQWRLALGEPANASMATTKRIRRLERELARKEKALAEAAALLVLKKKVDHLWEDEDDDTDAGNDK